ncbi:TraM recognition domain-containing protein [Halobacillus locisalis]|uniref:TraM recognition domain-containing protein n=1 Tax=Halobacillus locisalis TaxID=220753 RepID=A0A838CXF1_9BACI|nr:TraM recognition domain-containing protein [Halobacillus locisalis]MBA2176822.1 TraM recognition domain-containing protein [Halobacillus locisalis]
MGSTIPYNTDRSIMWGGKDAFTHMLVTGATRSGKTASILEYMCYQLLLQKKKGKKLGFTLIEPKGDSIQVVKELCDEMDIPYIYIDPENPDETDKFNVMEGPVEEVAEATVAVLQSLFGKQEAFFQTIQEISSRNITKLLKELQGDEMDLLDVLKTLRSPEILKQRVADLKQKQPDSELVKFFEYELLGEQAQDYRKLVLGLRAQLENVTSNEYLRKVISGKSDINLNEHFEKGGVLLVNTSLAKLKKSGDAFGQFVAMHLQSATFRRPRPKWGQERVPHYFICDEYSRYINPDVEIFLSLAASYRVAGILATQSLGQLEIEAGKISGRAMKKAILSNCRNKIAFVGHTYEDAQEFADEFGKDQVTIRQSTFTNRILMPRLFPDSYRDTESEEYRFTPTYLMDGMKQYHFVCKMLKDGTPQKPFEAKGRIIPPDWKELREWEDDESSQGALEEMVGKAKQLFKSFKNKTKQDSNKAIEKKEKVEPDITERDDDIYIEESAEDEVDTILTPSEQLEHERTNQEPWEEQYAPYDPNDVPLEPYIPHSSEDEESMQNLLEEMNLLDEGFAIEETDDSESPSVIPDSPVEEKPPSTKEVENEKASKKTSSFNADGFY